MKKIKRTIEDLERLLEEEQDAEVKTALEREISILSKHLEKIESEKGGNDG